MVLIVFVGSICRTRGGGELRDWPLQNLLTKIIEQKVIHDFSVYAEAINDMQSHINHAIKVFK